MQRLRLRVEPNKYNQNYKDDWIILEILIKGLLTRKYHQDTLREKNSIEITKQYHIPVIHCPRSYKKNTKTG
jgi:hypothetical protein